MESTMVRVLRGIAAGAFIVALPLLLVTSAVRWLASDIAYYEHGLRAHGAEERTGLPLSELDRASQEIIDYFQNDDSRLHIVVTVNGMEQALFNEREILHMVDVKNLMRGLFRVNEVALVVVMSYIALVVLWAGERTPQGLARLALGGVGAGVAAVGFIAVFAVAGFDQAWTAFHEIAFRNDLWLLDPDTDRLIQMFPEPFWQETTYLAGVLIAAQSVLVVIVSAGYLLATRRAKGTDSVAG
jgi:integral membrane protein (TIGR01906 family)